MPNRAHSPATIERIAAAIRPGEAVTVRQVLPRLPYDHHPGTVRKVLGLLTRAGRLEAIEDASHPVILVKRYRLVQQCKR